MSASKRSKQKELMIVRTKPTSGRRKGTLANEAVKIYKRTNPYIHQNVLVSGIARKSWRRPRGPGGQARQLYRGLQTSGDAWLAGMSQENSVYLPEENVTYPNPNAAYVKTTGGGRGAPQVPPFMKELKLPRLGDSSDATEVKTVRDDPPRNRFYPRERGLAIERSRQMTEIVDKSDENDERTELANKLLAKLDGLEDVSTNAETTGKVNHTEIVSSVGFSYEDSWISLPKKERGEERSSLSNSSLADVSEVNSADLLSVTAHFVSTGREHSSVTRELLDDVNETSKTFPIRAEEMENVRETDPTDTITVLTLQKSCVPFQTNLQTGNTTLNDNNASDPSCDGEEHVKEIEETHKTNILRSKSNQGSLKHLSTLSQTLTEKQNSAIEDLSLSDRRLIPSHIYTGYRSSTQIVANSVYEHVFLITTGCLSRQSLPLVCVIIPDLAGENNDLINSRNIDQVVLERVQMSEDSLKLVDKSLTGPSKKHRKHAMETNSFRYLHCCYERWKSLKEDTQYRCVQDDVEKCRTVIACCAKTCLQNPEDFTHQTASIPCQFIDLCREFNAEILDTRSNIHQFIMDIVSQIEDEEGSMSLCFKPILEVIRNRFANEYGLKHFNEVEQHINILKLFTIRPSLAKVMVLFNEVKSESAAYSYEQTLLGSLLAMSSWPRYGHNTADFFEDVADTDDARIQPINEYIWQRLDTLCVHIHEILMETIKLSTDLRHKVMYWIGHCLSANRGRPDAETSASSENSLDRFCSDGFLLNLCHVMLLMCQPFSEPNSEKLLHIKPSYCRASVSSESEMETNSVHAIGLPKENTLIPYTEDMKLPEESSYHFISECFFLTHQALHIGYNSIHTIVSLEEDIGEDSKKHVQKFGQLLGMRAAFTENFSKMSLEFELATASWLVQVATRNDVTDFKDLKLPLSTEVPKELAYLPEFIIETLPHVFSAMDILNHTGIIRAFSDKLQHIVSMVLVFVDAPQRLANLDIRVTLIEILDTLVSVFKEKPSQEGKKVFEDHPAIATLSGKCMGLFIDAGCIEDVHRVICRKSIHRILQYVWQKSCHKEAVTDLTKRAMSDSEHSLLLQFLDCVMNDIGSFFRDAIEHLEEYKILESEKDFCERQENVEELLHEKQDELEYNAIFCRSVNSMVGLTVRSLEMMAGETQELLCHSAVVNKLTGLLNYCLWNLVCEDVRDFTATQLELKSEQVLLSVCKMYVVLGTNSQFCEAVFNNEFYSSSVFKEADDIFLEIDVHEIFLGQFRELREKLERLAAVGATESNTENTHDGRA